MEISHNYTGAYTAKCPVLGLESKGGNADKVYDDIIETVTLFFEVGLMEDNLQKELNIRGVDPEIYKTVSDYYANMEYEVLLPNVYRGQRTGRPDKEDDMYGSIDPRQQH